MEYHIPKNTPKDMMDEEHKKIDRLIQKNISLLVMIPQ